MFDLFLTALIFGFVGVVGVGLSLRWLIAAIFRYGWGK